MIVMGLDLYNFAITGKEIAVTLNANSCMSANYAGPSILVLNDQGGCDEHEYQRYRNLESTGTRSSARCVGTFGDSVCYAIEGNVVDRNNSQNGKGWCENVSPTLNIQDRHAVVYRKAALIIYPIENHPADSHIVLQEPGSAIQTLNARMGTGGGNTPIVLMAVGGTDSHASITDGNVAPTMLARAGTGGGNEPIVLMENNE